MRFLHVVLKSSFLCELGGAYLTVVWGVVDKTVIVENTWSPELLPTLGAFIRLLFRMGYSVLFQSTSVFKPLLTNLAIHGIFFLSQMVFTYIVRRFFFDANHNHSFTLLFTFLLLSLYRVSPWKYLIDSHVCSVYVQTIHHLHQTVELAFLL